MEIISLSELKKRPDLLERIGLEKHEVNGELFWDCDHVKGTTLYPKLPIGINSHVRRQFNEDCNTRGNEMFITIGEPTREGCVYVFAAKPSTEAVKIIEWFDNPDSAKNIKGDIEPATWHHWKTYVKSGVAYRGGRGYSYALWPYNMHKIQE